MTRYLFCQTLLTHNSGDLRSETTRLAGVDTELPPAPTLSDPGYLLEIRTGSEFV